MTATPATDRVRLTRAETEILAADSDAIMSWAAPHELVELGSGSAVKTELVLGVDLVKSPDVLLPADDDAAGITAEFNRNVLRVVNRELAGDLPVSAFAHRAVWDPVTECIEMHLVATRAVRSRLRAIDLEVGFRAGQHIVTEHSCRFRVPHLRRELAAAGLRMTQVLTDRQDRYAVVLARRDGPRRDRSPAVVAHAHRPA